MDITHVQGIFSPEHGGPTQSLANYCRRQAAANHRVSVWTLEGYANTSPAVKLEAPIEMHAFRVETPARLGCSSEMRRQLRMADSPDIYHLHGVWLRAMHYGAREAARRKCPYMLEVNGMYEPWALCQKWLQKRIARWWFQDRILHEASCLHVNSIQEVEQLRKLGFTAPAAVIPGGIDLDEIDRQKPVLPSASPWRELQGRPFILYLSRLHPKKGLDLLIRAWAKIQRTEVGSQRSEGRSPSSVVRCPSSDFRLVIAGSGEPDYVEQCKKLAAELGIANQCFWAGRVDELQKSWLFTNAHCYVLPTFSENFGNVVVESLAHGTPVITTIYTPWTDLPKHHCGWIIDNTESELIQALNVAMRMDAATRQKMGENGGKLVHEYYSLELVTKNILSVYEWLLGTGPKPGCIV
jgi:glycosyltransferase involved in cell wall biosynthesis